jgi:hypothetical protein
MELSGSFGDSVDNWLGIPYHVLDSIPIRDQRKVVKNRAQQILQQQNSLALHYELKTTKPMSIRMNKSIREKEDLKLFSSILQEKSTTDSVLGGDSAMKSLQTTWQETSKDLPPISLAASNRSQMLIDKERGI